MKLNRIFRLEICAFKILIKVFKMKNNKFLEIFTYFRCVLNIVYRKMSITRTQFTRFFAKLWLISISLRNGDGIICDRLFSHKNF